MTMTANTAPFQLTAKSIWPYAVSAALMITLGHTCVSSFLDYRKWIAFGKGAPPGCDNAYGYCLFRLQKLFLLLVRDKGTTDTSFARKYPESTRFLALKESRSGRRPDMVPWLLPQRQTGPYAMTSEWRARIKSLLYEVVNETNASYPRSGPIVQIGTSRLEGFGPAVQMADGPLSVCQDSETCFREVAHLHAQDASLHIILSPADAAAVIEKGWAERFGWAGRLAINGRLKGKTFPDGMVLVYFPRDEGELEVVKRIIKASIAFAMKV